MTPVVRCSKPTTQDRVYHYAGDGVADAGPLAGGERNMATHRTISDRPRGGYASLIVSFLMLIAGVTLLVR